MASGEILVVLSSRSNSASSSDLTDLGDADEAPESGEEFLEDVVVVVEGLLSAVTFINPIALSLFSLSFVSSSCSFMDSLSALFDLPRLSVDPDFSLRGSLVDLGVEDESTLNGEEG